MIEYPNRVWSITRYVLNGIEVPYDTPGATALWSSKEPTDEDRIRRRLATHDSEKRLHAMKERIFNEAKRQREEELRRRG